jgi:oligopeptide transport system ATP-binding protein
MVMEPELVVADEPISALDVSIRAQVLNLLKKFQEEQGTTYLFVAHDLSIVRFISDRIGVIYKGNIVEVAEAEELFDYPLHPYTRSLISAIPIPDPQLEKNKVLFTYDPSVHDYSEEQPELVNIGHGHYVYGNTKEIEEYKAIRDAGVPMKSITIVDPENRTEDAPVNQEIDWNSSQFLLQTPLNDTGSIWYTIGSFVLPPLGIIGGLIFKKFKHLRNAKACFKGAWIGLGLLGALIALFGIALVLALL